MQTRFVSFVILSTILLGFTVRARAGDQIVVMPFENRSQQPEYNWIRESFVILMADLLDAPGVVIIGAGERNMAFEKLRLNPSDLLTRAAMIRVAETAQANLVLLGEFDIGGERGNMSIAINARLVETPEGRLVGNKVFNFSGPLSDLQQMQGQLAWNILYMRNPSISYSKEQLLRRSANVPGRAYESYVKAVQTQDVKLREGFLRRAIQEYEGEGGTGRYAQAIYELGMLSYRQSDFAEATKLFKDLNPNDPNYAEGLFYLGLATIKSGDTNESLIAYTKLVDILPMLEVFNNVGVLMLAKGDNANALQMLWRAVANSPNDPFYRFNYGYALWRNKNYQEAAQHLRVSVKANPRDGEAQFLLARCLAATGQQAEATQIDNDAKRYLDNYAKWAVAPERMPLLVRLKQEFNRAAFYQLERQPQDVTQVSPGTTPQQISRRQILDRARQFVMANKDPEAMAEVQRVLAVEATNAEAHYIRGVILYRRGETETAIKALQSAVTWNPRLIEAHISLAQMYLVRGDRALALAHSKQALEIDPQNREALALKQQIETGR
ncbi:MAG TPA: tetratricopeptide repeat protein [Blastocatellia bacterium]|nr:tetratricopeptide repeat protein [Blastocatellia bacterium]